MSTSNPRVSRQTNSGVTFRLTCSWSCPRAAVAVSAKVSSTLFAPRSSRSVYAAARCFPLACARLRSRRSPQRRRRGVQESLRKRLLESRRGGWTRVRPHAQAEPHREDDSFQDYEQQLFYGWRRPAASGAVIRLLGGLPDPALFPRREWLRHYRSALAELPYAAMSYPDILGAEPLRQALADYLGRVRGAVTTPERIIVCGGFTQGLTLLCRVLRSAGAQRVAVEEPCHTWHRAAIGATGLEAVPITVDERGLDPAVLADARADAILVAPAHSYPRGGTLDGARRQALVSWAEHTGALIIEDDYDAELRYDRSPLGALQGLAPDHVIYIGSVSKTLTPALRLGWLVAPPRLIEPLAARVIQSASSPLSADASASRLLGGRDRAAHDAMVLALGPFVAEAGLLIEAARGVVEKLGRDLLALRVLRIALHHTTARLRDEVEGTTKRHTRDAFPSIIPVHEDARDAIVRKLFRSVRLVVLPVVDVRKLVRRAELAPRHRGVAVEGQGRVSLPLANETLLPRAAHFALRPTFSRMEPRAPATTEPAPVVLIEETGEGIPSRVIKRSDRVLAHAPSVHRLRSDRRGEFTCVEEYSSVSNRPSPVGISDSSAAPSVVASYLRVEERELEAGGRK